MKLEHTLSLTLATISVAAAIVTPALAQNPSSTGKIAMPAIAGNVQMPAGQQNQVGGPMGETGTTLQPAMPAARVEAPVRVVTPAPAPVRMVAAPAAAPAPMAAPAPAPAPVSKPLRRPARADRG